MSTTVVAFPTAQHAELSSVLRAQRESFNHRHEPASAEERRLALSTLGRLLIENRYRIAEAISADFGGRAKVESLLMEVYALLEEIRHARGRLKRWMKPRRASVNWMFRPSRAQLFPQPLGVVGVIGASNYPVFLALSPTIGALAGGNHVMIKPPTVTPHTSELLRELISDAFKPEYLTVVTGPGEVGKAFAKLPFDHLVFTGSPRTGRSVMRDAAENLVPVTLELGGKSPAIVGDDYPVVEAVKAILQSRLINGGQTCVAADYALVPETRAEEFATQACATAAAYYPRLVSNPDYTRLVSRSEYERLNGWLDEARRLGARVEQINPAGEDCNADNRVFPPTIVWNCPRDAQLLKGEIFGPILPVVAYRSLDEAIHLVNSGERPLALYFFGHRKAEVDAVLTRTVSGGVTVNGCGLHAIQHNLPFGGVGNSGMGHYRGQFGFERFSMMKPVFYTSRFNMLSLMYPPYGRLMQWIVGLMLHNRPIRERL